jgi:RNA recognition motif-containing protein
MTTEDGARAAIDQFNDKEFEGRRLAVNEARPPAGGGGRGFGGGGGFGGGRGGDGGGRRREPRW